jgi:hypothetical protein
MAVTTKEHLWQRVLKSTPSFKLIIVLIGFSTSSAGKDRGRSENADYYHVHDTRLFEIPYRGHSYQARSATRI